MHHHFPYHKPLSDMEGRTLFKCFSRKFASECDSKEELHESIAGLCSIPDSLWQKAALQVLTPECKIVYGPNIPGNGFQNHQEVQAAESFELDVQETAYYFDKVLYQDSGEALEEYWRYVQSLKAEGD